MKYFSNITNYISLLNAKKSSFCPSKPDKNPPLRYTAIIEEAQLECMCQNSPDE